MLGGKESRASVRFLKCRLWGIAILRRGSRNQHFQSTLLVGREGGGHKKDYSDNIDNSGLSLTYRLDTEWLSYTCWETSLLYFNHHSTPSHQVTCCASVPDCRLLFFAGTSGVISVFKTKFNPSKVISKVSSMSCMKPLHGILFEKQAILESIA